MLLRSMDALATKVDVKNINGKLDKMSKTLVENSSTLVQLIEEMKEIRKSQQFLSDQCEEMKKHLHSTDEEVKTLRIENQDLKDHVRKLEAESGQMQEDINNFEQYGRRDCLEFQGLSCEESENTDQLVIGVSKLLQVDLSAKDINVSHRLSPASESNRQPAIIARLCSRRIRDGVFNNRHRLRAHNKDHPKACIFINERLTKINRRHFNQCLRFKKENNLKFMWTKNGITYLRKDEGTPAFTIKNETDLVRHGIVAS